MFRGLLHALSSLKLSIKQIHRNIFRFRKSFSKYRNISFSVHKVPFQISACWEICHKDSLCLIACPKAAFLSQQQASAPAVPNGPRYAAKDSLFPLLPPPSQERFALIPTSPGTIWMWNSLHSPEGCADKHGKVLVRFLPFRTALHVPQASVK